MSLRGWVWPQTHFPSHITFVTYTPVAPYSSVPLMTGLTKSKYCACLIADSLFLDFSTFQTIKLGTDFTYLKVVFTAFDHDAISCLLVTGWGTSFSLATLGHFLFSISAQLSTFIRIAITVRRLSMLVFLIETNLTLRLGFLGVAWSLPVIWRGTEETPFPEPLSLIDLFISRSSSAGQCKAIDSELNWGNFTSISLPTERVPPNVLRSGLLILFC